jgi:acyl dehydratase
MAMTRRTFSLEDQRAFARMSGDWNPLHVDPIAARRTMFEVPIVHGIHLLVWALDTWLAAREPISITSLKAAFRKPLPLDTEVALEIMDEASQAHADNAAPVSAEATTRASSVRITGTAAEHRVLEATIAFAAAGFGSAATSDLPRAEFAEAPRFVARETIAHERGHTPLALDGAGAAVMFPHARRALGELVIAELLATTRIVGMECPGLYSVFAELDLHRRARPAESSDLAIDWSVSRTSLKYSVVDLAVRGAVFEGTLGTFYRPQPHDGPTNEQVRDVVRAGEFHGQRALVVGGSRGLGEAIARCLAAGGAEVCITYHRGAAEANRIVRDAAALSGRLAAIPLDVIGPVDLRWPFEVAPTHVYYLATPRIPTVAKFARIELDHLLRYYVDGLLAVTGAACALGSPIVVWVPSTSFLNDCGGSAAYCMAKAAMEELCRRLPKMMPVRVRVPRLPRIATDQTTGLVQLPAASALEVALAELRAVAEVTP